MLQFKKTLDANNHSEGAGRIKNRSLHAQESSGSCEITDGFQPGQGEAEAIALALDEKAQIRRHR